MSVIGIEGMARNKRKTPLQRDRGKYPRKKLIDAVLEVLNGHLTVPGASKKFNLPGRTVRRWVR